MRFAAVWVFGWIGVIAVALVRGGAANARVHPDSFARAGGLALFSFMAGAAVGALVALALIGAPGERR